MAEFKKEKQNIPAKELLAAIARGDVIDLNRCTIEGPLDINRYFDDHSTVMKDQLKFDQSDDRIIISIDQKLNFNNCLFEDDVVFASPWGNPEAITVIFNQDVSFNSSIFKGQTRFSNATFIAHGGFDGCSFSGVVCFRGSRFCKAAMFRTATFHGYGLFNNACFDFNTRFSSTFFSKGVNFTNVRFKHYTDFAGVYAGSKTVPVYDGITFAKAKNGDDETFWRFIKQCAQESGHYQLAGEIFYKERCAHLLLKLKGNNYEQLKWYQKILRYFAGIRLLPEFIFGRLLFGYGERPIRVLVSSALVIIGCAILYYINSTHVLFKGEIIDDARFFDYLYFSVTTFATLGLGDVFPKGDSFLRIVVMSEVLAGACLMSLFVVSLAKRFSRS